MSNEARRVRRLYSGIPRIQAANRSSSGCRVGNGRKAAKTRINSSGLVSLRAALTSRSNKAAPASYAPSVFRTKRAESDRASARLLSPSQSRARGRHPASRKVSLEACLHLRARPVSRISSCSARELAPSLPRHVASAWATNLAPLCERDRPLSQAISSPSPSARDCSAPDQDDPGVRDKWNQAQPSLGRPALERVPTVGHPELSPRNIAMPTDPLI